MMDEMVKLKREVRWYAESIMLLVLMMGMSNRFRIMALHADVDGRLGYEMIISTLFFIASLVVAGAIARRECKPERS